MIVHAAGFWSVSGGKSRTGRLVEPLYLFDYVALQSAPFTHLSHATPVPLRHRAACAAPVLGPVGIRCVPRLPRPLSDTIAGCRCKTAARVRRGHQSRTPLGPPTRHTRAPTFFSREENHFPHEPREQLRVSSRPKAHDPSRLGDAHPVYPTTDERECSTGCGGWEEGM